MNTSAEPVNSTTAPTADAPIIDKSRLLYWVAFNKGFVSLSPIPLPWTVKCSRTPQLLFGVDSLEDAKELESIARTATISTILRRFRSLHPKSDVVGKVLHSEPLTTDSMTWTAD